MQTEPVTPEKNSPRLHVVAPRARLMVPESAAVLKRLYFMLRELVVMQAGWVPGTAHWETKLLLPELLWEDSTTLRLLRERILELRYPERRIVPGEDAAVLAEWAGLANAPSGEAFARGGLVAGKRALRRMAEAYLRVADALNDGPTVRILGQLVADLARHELRLRETCPASSAGSADARWSDAVTAGLDAYDVVALIEPTPAPPALIGMAGERAFAVDREGARDGRFEVRRFAWPDRLDNSRKAGEGLELQLRVAVHHLNEIWATEMAASVIHDLAGEAPADFLEEAARWCYDEARHCRMGHARLKAWGFKDEELPLDRFSYAASGGSDALVRLGTIFYFETTYIHTKSERTRIFTREGDRLSAHDMDFDWADELIHTYYGSKWLKHFLTERKDARTPDGIKDEALACVRRWQLATADEERAATEATYARLLARARELSAGAAA